MSKECVKGFGEFLEYYKKYDFSNHPNYFKYYSNDLIDKVFNDKTLKFSFPSSFNDAIEFNPIINTGFEGSEKRYILNRVKMPSIEDMYSRKCVEPIRREVGVLCLTKNPQCFSMWNYYANGHKGFLIELKGRFNEYDIFRRLDGEISPIKRIEYVPIFQISIPQITDATGASFSIQEFNEKLFYTKTDRWSYEQEYRLVLDKKVLEARQKSADENGIILEIPPDMISSVTFGALMSKSDKENIAKLLEGTGIALQQAVIIPDEIGDDGKSGLILVLPEQDENWIVDMDYFFTRKQLLLEIMDKTCYREVGSIKDLPYYHAFQKDTEYLYENLLKTNVKNG